MHHHDIPWFDDQKDTAITHALTRFRTHPHAVLVLQGSAGSGIGTAGMAIAASLAETHRIVRIRGTHFGQDTPYFAIQHALGGAASPQDSPLSILRRFEDTVLGEAGERPVLLYILNFEQLDPLSAALLGTLLGSGRMGALITCPDVATQAVLLSLAATQVLETVELEPLGASTVTAQVESYLGGLVPRRVAEWLLQAAGGNPALLRMLCDQAVRGGWLRRTGDHWTLDEERDWAEEPLSSGGLLGAVGTLPTPQRALLARVAILGPQPGAELSAAFGEENLAALEAAELIQASIDGTLYAAANIATAAAMRTLVDEAERRDIWRESGFLPQPETEPDVVLRGLQAGIEPGDTRILAAAADASNGHRPRLSNALLDYARGSDEEYLLHARNARQLGEIPAALARLRSLPGNSAALFQEFLIELENHGDPEAAAGVLARLDAAVLNDRDRARRDLARVLLLEHRAEFDAMIAEGEAHLRDPEVVADSTAELPEVQVTALLVAEALCVRGRQREGLALARRIYTGSEEGPSPELRDVAAVVMWRIFFLSGHWDECHALVSRRRHTYPEAGGLVSGLAEMAQGLVLYLRGDTLAAQHPLACARSMLGQHHSASLSPVPGETWVSERDSVEQIQERFRIESARFDVPGIPQFSRFLATILLALRNAADLSAPAAVALYHEIGAGHHARGEYGFELFAASGLIRTLLNRPVQERIGALDPAQRLRIDAAIEGAVRRNSGPLAQVCGVFATALYEPGPTIRAGILLGDALGMGTFFTSDPGETHGDMPTRNTFIPAAAPVRGITLNERENTIFEALNRGLKNREIAALLGISPRTAEGHVQRLYRTLGVGSRAELYAAFRPPVDIRAVDGGGAERVLPG